MIKHNYVKIVVLLDKYGKIINVNLSVEIQISLITPLLINFVITMKKELLLDKDLVTVGVQILKNK